MGEEEVENGGSGGAGADVEDEGIEFWVCALGEEEFDEGFVAEKGAGVRRY